MEQDTKPEMKLPMFSVLKEYYEKQQKKEEQKEKLKQLRESTRPKKQNIQQDLFSSEDFLEQHVDATPKNESLENSNVLRKDLSADSFCNEADFVSNNYHQKKQFADVHLENTELYDYTFDRCIFKNCSFKNVQFTNATLSDCEFYNCELILCKQDGTTFDNVFFKSSRLTGINFTECAEFGFSPYFTDSMLDSCVFYDNTLNNCRILECTVRNTDFSNCHMKGTDFSMTRFQTCTFLGCNMENADFRTATGYNIDPKANTLKKARFSLPEAASFFKYMGITIE